MPSEPTLFDDEGDPRAGSNDDHGRHGHDHTGSATGRAGGPNYLFRRAVVVGGIVAVIATAGIVIGGLLDDAGETSTSGALPAEWNRIVLIDERSGRVVLVDDVGDERARIDSAVTGTEASAVSGATAVLASSPDTAVVDLADESSTSYDLAGSTVSSPAGSALTLVASGTGRDRGLLVHGPSGDVIDTAEFPTIVGARYDFPAASSTTDGRAVLVTDAGNFQSVLFSFGADEPAFFPGLALALDDAVVVTAQNVGTEATVAVFDHEGAPISSARTPTVRAGIVGDDAVHVVTVDGEIVRVAVGSDDIEPVGRLDVGTVATGWVSTSGDRLVVVGADGTAIVDDGGGVVGMFPGQTPADPVRLGASCVALTGGTEPALTVASLGDGAVEAESTAADPVATTADGCTVVATTAGGYEVIGPDSTVVVETADVAVDVVPDGTAVAVERERRLVLVPTATAEGEPGGASDDDPDAEVDLGPATRTVWFTEL